MYYIAASLEAFFKIRTWPEGYAKAI